MAKNYTDWEDFLNENEKFDVIVDTKGFKKILEDLGNKTDKDGFILNNRGDREISKDEDDIRLDQLGVLASGSKIFIKNNIASFSEYLIEKKKR